MITTTNTITKTKRIGGKLLTVTETIIEEIYPCSPKYKQIKKQQDTQQNKQNTKKKVKKSSKKKLTTKK